ncbi:type I restriction modification DNA specificity domain protein [Methanobrevibacter cuticularis]|uniref:Type I restriction modification DNA specificity domain protein n=1 Tax=Methanobrevibacter cuticularis TaxID=47311 RepID=A0A166D6B3_9EURY|nr:restriction endonuclease subunit S [Methanobrevibacter cuticularis]KZX15248.1 type I restriction modification DNA specificity domain protein [Methanobrevibacter cuticularis]
MNYELHNICSLISEKIKINEKINENTINLHNYISTENMLPNREGVRNAEKLPSTNSINTFSKNDVLISNIRPYFKKIWFANYDGGCSGDILVLRPKKNIHPLFLYYILSNDEFFEYATLTAKGTKMPRGDKTAIMKYEVPDISLEKQTWIVEKLKYIDEKISINNKINHNLQQIIKLLFKAWFIDFDPFKKNGMKESELGLIPKKWDIIELKDIFDVFNGYSYKGNELQESNNAMVTIKNFDRNGGFKLDGFKEIIFSDKIKDYHFVNLFDVIVAHTDVTQNADIIGNAAILLNKMNYDKIIMSMDLVKVSSKIPQINNFLLVSILDNYRFKGHALGYVNGTTVLHLNKKAVPDYKIALPQDLSICEKLGGIIEKIYIQISTNNREIFKLTELRDIMLPKLMNGEIDISNADF